MYSKHRYLFTLLLVGILGLVIPSSVSACTYNSTITGNHLDIQVQNNDWPNLGVLEIISFSHTAIWEKMYQPSGVNWVTTWDNLGNNMYFGLIGGLNGDTAYWGFNALTVTTITIPYGVYGVDFIGSLSHQDYYIQMNHPEDFGSNYFVCTRNGEVINQNLVTPTKVIFVPGLGASWNANAILNCTKDTNSSWTLAPFAEDIYNPVIQAINEYGWTTIPFYYDWRNPVLQNSKQLASFIDQNSMAEEMVNLVGHSMGGLIGRGYLEASSGGKLSSLLTVGSPHKGSALAYPPWAGGEIWNDNFLIKIAMTLYLKHCGGIPATDKDIIHYELPSVKDLLPTDPYLQKNKIADLYLPTNPENKNDWLNNLSSKSWGVRLGYIAGTSFNTLKIIQTKDPNKKDFYLGIWVDGKPTGKTFSPDGDGTVLSSSAILPNASFSATIDQTHTGLVTSAEGVAKILEFLGKTETVTTQPTSHLNTVEPNSALIIIGYPADFTVTDKNGKSKMDKDGMISFMNPESGSYKLNLIPKSNNTLFIVTQFLPNGNVKYKEYNFEGFGPKFKTVLFDPLNPVDDPLY